MERGKVPTTIPPSFLGFEMVAVVLKGVVLLFLVFYAIFALIIVRQVNLMSKTLITGVSPFLKAFSILHAGFAIGLIILAWGIL